MLLEESSLRGYAMLDASARMRFRSDNFDHFTLDWSQHLLSFLYIVHLVLQALNSTHLNCRHASSSNNSYQESATAMRWYLKLFSVFSVIIPLSLKAGLVVKCDCVPLCSKYVTATWNWRTHYWTEAQLLGWRSVILGIPRYMVVFLSLAQLFVFPKYYLLI